MNAQTPGRLHRDPANKPRSSSRTLVVLIAIIIVGALGFMIFHRIASPSPIGSASPMESKKTSHSPR